MAYEQKPNSGAVYVNDNKEPGSNQPDRRGKALIDGVEYWVSGWLKKTKDNKPFLSLSFSPVDKQQGGSSRQQPQRQQAEDDIAF